MVSLLFFPADRRRMHNQSIGHEKVWTENGLTYTEQIAQAYDNCVFSAGTVEGHPVDTLYLHLTRDGVTHGFLLRPDEAAALAWCLNGVLWSDLIGKQIEASHVPA